MNFELSVTDITPQNRRLKMLKAVRALSQHLGVPVSVEGRNHNHGPEPFLFKAQEQLNYKWYNTFSLALRETYSFVIGYFGLPEITTVLKASPGDVLTHKGKVLYSPETGQPIKKTDWDRFVVLLEKYLNHKLKDTDKKIVLDSKALGRILNRMLKYNTFEAVKDLPLSDVKYRGKTLDWISDSVKNMQSAFGDDLSRGEMARIQVLQTSAAEKITKTSAAVKSDIRQILIDGVKNRKSKGQVSQAIFDRMTGANRDFQRIADTEIQNASNNSFLLDEVSNAEPGEKVYFQRIERIDSNTCNFCKKMHGVIVLWSDHPLEKDKIDDPVADYAIWDGKDWDGKKEMDANGVFHPYCRGVWVRHNGSAVNALVAEIQGKSKQFNEALEKTKQEYETKGVKNPNDTTPGLEKRLNENYGPKRGEYNQKKYADAFNQARKEFEAQGIDHPTGKTPGFRDRIQEIYQQSMDKSLTWSGYKLQDRYRFAGFNISVENKKGSTRSGTDKDGHKWAVKMNFDYGYIRGTVGVDKDHVDVYIGDNEDAQNVYIVHQNNPVTGKYDEDKIMLGFDSLHEARNAYLKQYDRPGFLGSIDAMPLEEFREKVLSNKFKGKTVKSLSQRVIETLGGIQW
jgi:hypothetical protein